MQVESNVEHSRGMFLYYFLPASNDRLVLNVPKTLLQNTMHQGNRDLMDIGKLREKSVNIGQDLLSSTKYTSTEYHALG